MILLTAIVAGLAAGLLRSHLNHRPFEIPNLRWTWLVFVSLLPQILAFYMPQTSVLVPQEFASASLILSQIGLLLFAWGNRHLFAVWIMGAGLIMNLLVIVANGGLMPISPQTVTALVGRPSASLWPVGERFGRSKDIVLPPEETNLLWLSDRFVTPSWSPWSVAFSLGDVLLALGAFVLLWQAGGSLSPHSTEH